RGRRARSSPLTLGDSVTQSIRMRFSVHTTREQRIPSHMWHSCSAPLEPGTTFRRRALFVCEGSPASPLSPTGHPRNKQNGSEECPRSSYHAGRGHQAQGGRLMMKIAFVLAAAAAAVMLTTAPLATPAKAQELKMAQG